MLSTKRSRVRAVAIAGMAVVAGGIATVTFNASAAEVTPTTAAGARHGAAPVTPALPAIADAIKPPTGSKVIGVYQVVSGTQNYTCVVADGATTGTYSGASTPEAQLLGTGGPVHHFGGPSWQSLRDQSLVTATKAGTNTKTGTIPELLLQVATHTGTGIMTNADYINRLATSGGVAPTTSCTAGQVVKVPYKATYVFWDAPAA